MDHGIIRVEHPDVLLFSHDEGKHWFRFFCMGGCFWVLMIAQFWAYAADSFNLKAGQRIFPIIMIGAALGGVAGPLITKWLVNISGPGLVLLTAAGFLAFTLLLTESARRLIPPTSLCVDCHIQPSKFQNILGGAALVFQQRYLFLIAIFVVILNCINSTGEYILSKQIVFQSEQIISTTTDPGLNLSTVIVELYGNFYFWVNTCSLVLQAFLVGRIYSFMGIGLSALIMPVFVLIGYLLIGFIPIFTIIYLFKIVENAIDYSVMNTTRQALFLPLSQEEKYHGKTAIDTFFWRFGDVVQAGVVFAGIRYFNFATAEFVWLSVALSLIWIVVGIYIVKHYRKLKKSERLARQRAAKPDCTISAHTHPMDKHS